VPTRGLTPDLKPPFNTPQVFDSPQSLHFHRPAFRGGCHPTVRTVRALDRPAHSPDFHAAAGRNPRLSKFRAKLGTWPKRGGGVLGWHPRGPVDSICVFSLSDGVWVKVFNGVGESFTLGTVLFTELG